MPLTPDELERRAKQRAHRDIGLLRESGLPITPELVRAMACRAAQEDAAHDAQQEVVSSTTLATQETQEPPPSKPSWIGRIFGK